MTNCEKIAELLQALTDGPLDPAEQTAKDAHIAGCDSCASAWQAYEALRAHRVRAVPEPRAELFAEIMQLATQGKTVERSASGGRFWLGAGVGGALAAGIVFAVLSFNPIVQEQSALGTPRLTIALNETRDVNVAIDSPLALQGAQIRVVLIGSVALAGFEGQGEVQWSTNLNRGVNMLSLPVTMEGLGGGRVLVEVHHEKRHEIFVVDVQEAPEAGASMQPDQAFEQPGKSQA